MEQAADGRADRLGVVDLDAACGQDDRIRPERVGAPDDGAGVAGVADLRADDDEPGTLQRVPAEVELAADRHDPLRGDGVAELTHLALVGAPHRNVEAVEEIGVPGGVVDDHLVDEPGGERLTHRLAPLGEELACDIPAPALRQTTNRTQHRGGKSRCGVRF